MKQWYGLPTGYTAKPSNHSAAIVSFYDFFSEAALEAYTAKFNLPPANVIVTGNQTNCIPDCVRFVTIFVSSIQDQFESDLDVQAMVGIATGVKIYFDANIDADPTLTNDGFLEWAENINFYFPKNFPHTFSISYGVGEYDASCPPQLASCGESKIQLGFQLEISTKLSEFSSWNLLSQDRIRIPH